MPSKSFTLQYGSYKLFELPNHGNVVVTFSWDDPREVPKAIVPVFNDIVGERIEAFAASDEKRVKAVVQQLKGWEQKLRSREQLPELEAFVDTVNASLATPYRDIGGAAKVGEILARQACAELAKKKLEDVVRERLEKTSKSIKLKMSGTLALTIAKSAISGLATAGADTIASAVMEAIGGAEGLGKGCAKFYADWQALKSGNALLHRLLEDQLKLMKQAAERHKLVNAQLALMQIELDKRKLEALKVEADLKKVQKLIANLDKDAARTLQPAAGTIAAGLDLTASIRNDQVRTDGKKVDDLLSALQATQGLFDVEAVEKVLREMGMVEGWGSSIQHRLDQASKVVDLVRLAGKAVDSIRKL